MQKLKLQKKWVSTKNCFIDSLEIRETDKTITGKLSISSKQGQKWINKPIAFIVFKSQASQETQDAVRSGKAFFASFGISVNQFKSKEGKDIAYHQLIINEAKIAKDGGDSAKSANEQLDFQDDSIPF